MRHTGFAADWAVLHCSRIIGATAQCLIHCASSSVMPSGPEMNTSLRS